MSQLPDRCWRRLMVNRGEFVGQVLSIMVALRMIERKRGTMRKIITVVAMVVLLQLVAVSTSQAAPPASGPNNQRYNQGYYGYNHYNRGYHSYRQVYNQRYHYGQRSYYRYRSDYSRADYSYRDPYNRGYYTYRNAPYCGQYGSRAYSRPTGYQKYTYNYNYNSRYRY